MIFPRLIELVSWKVALFQLLEWIFHHWLDNLGLGLHRLRLYLVVGVSYCTEHALGFPFIRLGHRLIFWDPFHKNLVIGVRAERLYKQLVLL